MEWVRKFFQWHRGRTRRLDQKYLWSQFKRRMSIVEARMTFLEHAQNDPSWNKDLTNRQIADIVDGLD